MKYLIGLVTLALSLAASAVHAQSVCQLRTFGGYAWAVPPSASEPWGHMTFSDVADFLFDFPGEEGAADITNVNGSVPFSFVAGVKSVWGSDGAWHKWEPDGIWFSGYIVKGSTGAFSEPFALGPLQLKLTGAFDKWRTAVVAQGYAGVPSVLVHLSLAVRVCGKEDQLRAYLDDFDAKQAAKR